MFQTECQDGREPKFHSDVFGRRIKVRLYEHSSGKAAESSVSSPVRSLTDEDEENSLSTQSSRIGHLIPTDQGRWKSSKAAEQARSNFTQILKDLDISNNEENWSKWESYFHMLVESLELPTFVFGDTQPAPTTLSELMTSRADGNTKESENKVLPGLYRDVLGRIYHQHFPGVEIINEKEKRRFDAAMVLLFPSLPDPSSQLSILSLVTAAVLSILLSLTNYT